NLFGSGGGGFAFALRRIVGDHRAGLTGVVARIQRHPGLDGGYGVTVSSELLVAAREAEVAGARYLLLIAEKLIRRDVIVDRLLGRTGAVIRKAPEVVAAAVVGLELDQIRRNGLRRLVVGQLQQDVCGGPERSAVTAASLRKGHLRDRRLAPVAGLLQRGPEVADGTLIAALAAELFERPLDRIAFGHLRRQLDRQPLHGRGEIGVRHLRHARRAQG